MACCSGESDETTANIDAELKKNKQSNEEDIKLLLLGAGESGKSTIFKQLKIINQDGFSEKERNDMRESIQFGIVKGMQDILNGMKKLDIPFEPAYEEAAERVLDEPCLGGKPCLTAEMVADIRRLWTSSANVKKGYDRRAEYQLSDSTEYFLNAIDRCAEPGFQPTEADVLRVRVRTTGIVENQFDINDYHFRVYDVGGQQNERRKWIHAFEDVTAVLFCVGLSEYDQKLWEDESVNRMHEALSLFDEICNSKWFKNTSMILFLNKRDLFEEKIKTVDINVAFPEYTGGCDYKKALDYIKAAFSAKNRAGDSKQLYIKETCATDTENVKVVFKAVKDIILQDNLRSGGIL